MDMVLLSSPSLILRQEQPPEHSEVPPPLIMSNTCPRCPIHESPHQLGACDASFKRLLENKPESISKLWRGCTEQGDKADDPGDVQQSDTLIISYVAGIQHDDSPATKWRLENAFQQVYPGRKNQAEVERKKQSAQSAKSTQGAPKGSSFSHPQSNKGGTANTSEGKPFKITPAGKLPPPFNRDAYEFAVHRDSGLDDSLKELSKPYPGHSGSEGASLDVATNYVAVATKPLDIYMYSIDYGTITAVKTKKQVEEDAETQDDTRIAAATKGLSIATKSGGQDRTVDDRRKINQRSEKARLFSALGKRAPLKDIPYATDYELLWTLEPIKVNPITEIEYTKLSGRKYNLDHVTLTFQRTLQIPSSPNKASESLMNAQDITQKGASLRTAALNAFISKRVSLNSDIISVGPNKFFVKAGYTSSGPMLNIHRGYFTSIRPGSESVLLNVNSATSAFYQPRTVADLCKIVGRNYPGYGDPKELLKGLTVRIAYDREQHDSEYDPNLEHHRLRTIAGFGKSPAKQMFQLDGREITVAAYFMEKLGAPKLAHDDLGCVSVNVAPPKDSKPKDDGKDGTKTVKGKVAADRGTRKDAQPLWIPPEYLQLCPYQPFSRLLLDDHVDDMIKTALRHPAWNQDLIINEGFGLLGVSKEESSFEHFGLTVGHDLLRVPARKLSTPTIFYANDQSVDVSDGSWNFKDRQFFGIGTSVLHRAICTVDMRTASGSPGLNSLGLRLTNAVRRYGVNLGHQIDSTHRYINLIQTFGDNEYNDVAFCDALDEELRKQGRPRFLVVLLSKKDQGLYGTVKRVCDQWLGVHTICCVEKAISPQQVGNLALKFNIKFGGQNHQVGPSRATKSTSAFEEISHDTIVFGADVSHPAGGMAYTPSVAAVVASYDSAFARFSASMRLQAGTQETIEELEDMVYHRLLYFFDKRRSLPSRILFYRDGVSEDQFMMCQQNEIPKIKQAFKRASDQVKATRTAAKLTFVVVGKRHHTRFFACDETDTYQDPKGRPSHDRASTLNGNLKPGLIVDRVITRPPIEETFDFFLQSHAALKGTARSAHYTVLENRDLSVDAVQRLTLAFCHNYMRATKAVSYAGPAYYADRLCDRGAHYLRGYTSSPDNKGFEMNDVEKRMEKRDGTKALAKRVAQEISEHEVWNPRLSKDGREPNPWHPDFDGCMFWL